MFDGIITTLNANKVLCVHSYALFIILFYDIIWLHCCLNVPDFDLKYCNCFFVGLNLFWGKYVTTFTITDIKMEFKKKKENNLKVTYWKTFGDNLHQLLYYRLLWSPTLCLSILSNFLFSSKLPISSSGNQKLDPNQWNRHTVFFFCSNLFVFWLVYWHRLISHISCFRYMAFSKLGKISEYRYDYYHFQMLCPYWHLHT